MRVSDDLICSCLAPFGVSVSAPLCDQIRAYMKLLDVWNRRISLTSISDTRGILERHLGESMFAAAAVPIEHGRLADVGSGAGFPGIALKLIVPGLHVSLIESHGKKAVFLSEVVRSLNLRGVGVIRARFDEVCESSAFDYVAVRAVGSLPELLDWSERALRGGGRIVLWLGQCDAEELATSSRWTWQRPIPIQRSRQRVLLVGSPKG